MRIISQKEEPFPTDLEGRMNAVLNIVNTELKSAVFLGLGDIPQEKSEIRQNVSEIVGGGVHLPEARCIGGYCHQTFYPIGAVAEEVVVRETDETEYVGYRLTNAGRTYGLPICAFALSYVAKTGRSLFPILGSTSAPHGKQRSPLSRIKMLKHLRQGDARISDLEGSVDISDVAIRAGLVQLAKQNLVTFDSVKEVARGEGQVVYEWGGGETTDVKPYYTDVSLTRDIATLLKERGKITSSEALLATGKGGVDIRRFTNVLGHLVREGAARRPEWSGTQYSEVHIAPAGLDFLQNFSDPVERALFDEEALQEMKRGYHELMSNPRRLEAHAKAAINLYEAVSPKMNCMSRDKRNEQVVEFVKGHPGLRPVEIKRGLGWLDISHFLTSLTNAKVLRKEKTDREARYYVNE